MSMAKQYVSGGLDKVGPVLTPAALIGDVNNKPASNNVLIVFL